MSEYNYFKENIAEKEENLRKIGAEKCSICNIWMGKEYLTNGICDDCK